ncbi:hypothetical protein [Roseicyclus persicicus]|uniref:DUF1127 domain-containing protein n=1 Tax=Roseicyclus persicicus TaxID=2650661 RepID=A0A7X6GY45_9RHOB|nr:hypothetical protein [Roseibacterium persicicum]NKX43643.1 hypothetical protein [Roseibacterium persicicum]
MTTQTLPLSAIPSRGTAPVAAFFRALARAVALGSNAQARFDRVQRLQALSDDELARIGLKRDDIVRHVFADAFDA